MQNERSIIEAQAFIFDLLSLSFSYPTEELYMTLLDGRYGEELGQQVLKLPQSERITDLVRELSDYRNKVHAADYNTFESEYINLFEHGKDYAPLHPNAHIYSEDEPQPVPVYLRLKAIYGDFDVELDSAKATEQLDHISVQLEFFSYLHRLLLEDHDERARQKIDNAISDFCIELQWISRWAEQLQTRPMHAFYQPLALFLVLMLEMVCHRSIKIE